MEFFPGLHINSELIIEPITIKGTKPAFSYPFTLLDVYPLIPSLRMQEVMKIVLARLDRLHAKLEHRTGQMPKSPLGGFLKHDAGILFFHLFNPTKPLKTTIDSSDLNPFDFDHRQHIYPYSFEHASPAKIVHSMYWIDCNLKTQIESIGIKNNLPKGLIIELVESALHFYSLLIKMNDYELARRMNFNFSIFLQDRIVEVIFGELVKMDQETLWLRGKLSNEIALQYLKNFSSLDGSKLLEMSAFMGVVWYSTAEIQNDFLSQTAAGLQRVEEQFHKKRHVWAINDYSLFLSDLESCANGSITVILDDNGETVFDLALFQLIHTMYPQLKISFIVNQFPISNNISIEIFNAILEDPFFSQLKHSIVESQIKIFIEKQLFRSFEIDLLQTQTRAILDRSDIVYIKGANFFETFQLENSKRYHCFTVWGEGSERLTGFSEGEGVFVRLNPGELGFRVANTAEKLTLKDIIAKRMMNEKTSPSHN